ncbi:MAG: aminopeptidase N [Leptothrix sp. (in: b-proteobacteria)]
MREGSSPTTVRREDYTAPSHWIRRVDLTFELDPAKTLVISRMQVEPNADRPGEPLRLDGEDIVLTRVLVNGDSIAFRIEGQQLVLDKLPAEPFSLEIRNTCAPEKNTELSGLYTSGGSFFTQCEAQGFRRITYFLDRPDVMSLYSVTLRAHAATYPVLLSNGNLTDQGTLDAGRHYATWVDPHPKPAYLFALVAGKLVSREQRVRSRSGRDHLLQIYVRAGDLDKTEHAMNSLIASVVWDEARFGLSLDLERFMIVAVSDFNMGAMENKGLNIFNTKFVLANPATATDTDHANIEAVVGHEYFHNWTGNRVTCRDWFQLSLKEGLTVYRDQEFSQDMAGEASARAVKRIEDVRQLRQMQFPEDAGPMAHPVRPEQYQAIDNFYTTTVYEKGAEVVRMMATLVGRDGFRRGMDLYFARHDGQAVTCDDFAQAIADANPGSELATRLAAFKHWYAQAGTPRVHASTQWDAHQGSYTLTLSQHTGATPGQPVKRPFVIPVAFGLLDSDGRPLLLQLAGESQYSGVERVLVLDQPTQTFTFTGLHGLTGEPVPSLLRGFSAPVVLDWAAREDQLFTLLHHDTDPINRWEAGQRLGLARLIAAAQGEPTQALDTAYVTAQRSVLRDATLDAAFKELLLTPPSEGYVAEQLAAAGVPVDPARIHAARESMRAQLAHALADDWAWAFEAHHDNGAYRPDPVSSGRRALANLALGMRVLDAARSGDSVWPGRAYQRVKDAGNFTDRQGALVALLGAHHALAEPALALVHGLFKGEALVVDRWFALQAVAPERDGAVFARIGQLVRHPDYSLRNPNRARSLLSSLFLLNPSAFHRRDAAGYAFWSDKVVEVDALNPQLAARLARGLDRWRVLAEPYRSAAQAALQRVAARPELSQDTREIIDRALAD